MRFHLNNRIFLVVGLCIGLLFSASLVAAEKDDVARIRQIHLWAKQNRWEAVASFEHGASPLVRAYAEWLILQRENAELNFDRYASFLADHGDWPLTRRIRANAERVMDPEMDAARVIQFFRDALPVTARGMTLYIQAMEKSGEGRAARAVLNTWFRDVGLSRDEQDQIMTRFGKMIDRETLLYRLNEMIAKDQPGLARVLAARLGAGETAMIEARLALADLSKTAESKLARVPKNLMNDPGLVYDRLKFRRRKNDDSAAMLELFKSLPDGFAPVNSRGFWTEQEILIYRLMKEKKYPVAYQVAARPIHRDKFGRAQAEWMAGHIALVYLRQPGRGFRHFEALYKTGLSPLTRARGAFWAGEASAALGYPEVARAWYRSASAFRANFYGQMAAQKLPERIRSAHQGPPIATQADQASFNRAELPRLLRLLVAADAQDRADQVLNRMADIYAGQGGFMRLTVDLALELRMTSGAVKISRAAAMDGLDFADHVYPTLGKVEMSGVEPALVYAVIRQESGFDVDIVSSAGARGLMQLMPTTAKAVARAERERHLGDWLTARPAHNVRLGSAYLSQLIDQYESYALVAAAYNAGPGRVRQWLNEYGDPREGKIRLVDWIERIPIYETRNYVQRVLEGTAVYRQKLKTGGGVSQDPLHLQ